MVSLDLKLIILSGAAALLYGAVLVRRAPSVWRTAVKVTAIGGLAAVALVDEAPGLLSLALIFSAIGDGFLAAESRGRLILGLTAFLLAHLTYITLFAQDGGGRYALLVEPWRNLGVAGAMAAGAAMLIWLWRSLVGVLRPAVVLYAVALTVMAAMAFTLPHRLWPAMAGAVVFIASDALLSAGLFKGFKPRWATYLVWWLYYAAQVLLLGAYLW